MNLITIIIPCFNYGKFLPFTLDSIIQQTYPNWECIIVNDGSTDNTEAVAQEYTIRDNRIKYVFQVNSGLSAARNTGIKESKGEYLQFIDADDLIEPKKLEEQINFFKEKPSYDIIYGSVRYFRTQFPAERLYSMNRINKKWMPNVSGNGFKVLKFLFERNIMAANCPLVKKSVFEIVGLFNENLKYLEDWEFWIRCAINNLNFYYLDKPGTLALVRIHSKSMSNNIWDMRSIELEIKKDLTDKIQDLELNKILNKEIINVKKSLVGIAIYDLFKGNVLSFTNKLKIISEEDTLSAATLKIIKNNYFPNLTIGKLLFYGKRLIINSK
jgi:glycosyltransferase involved in cell wall biosynthesis